MLDFALPDEKTMALMGEAYKNMLCQRQGSTLSFDEDAFETAPKTRQNEDNTSKNIKFFDNNQTNLVQFDHKNRLTHCAHVSTKFLVLYFALVLMYNSTYGTAISYTDSRMGGVQPQKRPFGDLNGLF